MLLKKGSSGEDVKKVQQKLGLSADGVFGSNTEAAVIKYQKEKGLTADGVVGNNTWNSMMGTSQTTTTTPSANGTTASSATSSSSFPWGTAEQQNIKIILSACTGSGITNQFSQAGILAIVSKESSFKPQAETSYKNTAASRIKEIFKGARRYSDAEVDTIKKDDFNFWEMVYGFDTDKGKELGNKVKGDGGNFRGRGFNQITGRYLYEKYGKLAGVDLLTTPELLNSDISVAAKVLVAYMKNGIAILQKNGRLNSDYHAADVNGFSKLEDAIYAFYNCNAGTGKSFADIKADKTGGLAKALKNGPILYDYIIKL